MFASRSLQTIIAVVVLFVSVARAESEKHLSFTQLAEQRLAAARSTYQSNRTNAEAAWQFARACFDRADLAANDDQREEIANEGIAVCRELVAQHPNLAEAHYYLAMNLGEVAQTKSLGALRLVSEMEREFKTVAALDEKFDYAGADRNLGMLYHETPGWPASIGNKKKARQYLERARQLAPEFPDNRLYLLEAYLKWGDKKAAQQEYQTLQSLWPKMEKQFSGEKWARDWLDWQTRWHRIQQRFNHD